MQTPVLMLNTFVLWNLSENLCKHTSTWRDLQRSQASCWRMFRNCTAEAIRELVSVGLKWVQFELEVRVSCKLQSWEGNLSPCSEIENWAVAAHLSKTGNFTFPLLLIETACITQLLHVHTNTHTHPHTHTPGPATTQPHFYIRF